MAVVLRLYIYSDWVVTRSSLRSKLQSVLLLLLLATLYLLHSPHSNTESYKSIDCHRGSTKCSSIIKRHLWLFGFFFTHIWQLTSTFYLWLMARISATIEWRKGTALISAIMTSFVPLRIVSCSTVCLSVSTGRKDWHFNCQWDNAHRSVWKKHSKNLDVWP